MAEPGGLRDVQGMIKGRSLGQRSDTDRHTTSSNVCDRHLLLDAAAVARGRGAAVGLGQQTLSVPSSSKHSGHPHLTESLMRHASPQLPLVIRSEGDQRGSRRARAAGWPNKSPAGVGLAWAPTPGSFSRASGVPVAGRNPPRPTGSPPPDHASVMKNRDDQLTGGAGNPRGPGGHPPRAACRRWPHHATQILNESQPSPAQPERVAFSSPFCAPSVGAPGQIGAV